MIEVKLKEEPLDISEAYGNAVSECCGAVSLFVGTTRNNFDGHKVLRLTYEAYDKMALKMMNKVCEEIKEKWPAVENIVIHHRLGEVKVKEASVVIAIASPHRTEALIAVQYAIDRLKQLVPIFKKELFEDGDESWKANKECQWTS